MVENDAPAAEDLPPVPIAIQTMLTREGTEFLLRSSATDFSPSWYMGRLRILFRGRPAIMPGEGEAVTSDGFFENVRVMTFIWQFVSACLRLGDASSRREDIVVASGRHEYRLRLESRDGMVTLSLLRSSWSEASRDYSMTVVADAEVPLQKLLEEGLFIGRNEEAAIGDTNPDLIGSPHFRSFAASVERLGALLVAREREAGGTAPRSPSDQRA